MSSDTFIAYYGLRFEVDSDEAEGFEERSDTRVVAARKSGLKYYWGNFGVQEDQNLLFIGSQIGLLGAENAHAISLSEKEVQASFQATAEKLKASGFSENPSLHLVWQPDI